MPYVTVANLYVGLIACFVLLMVGAMFSVVGFWMWDNRNGPSSPDPVGDRRFGLRLALVGILMLLLSIGGFWFLVPLTKTTIPLARVVVFNIKKPPNN